MSPALPKSLYLTYVLAKCDLIYFIFAAGTDMLCFPTFSGSSLCTTDPQAQS